MGASIQVLSNGKTLAYFQFTADLPYGNAKALYNKLVAKLKAIMEKAEIKSLKDGRRINELATAYFSMKVPVNKVPVDYFSWTMPARVI